LVVYQIFTRLFGNKKQQNLRYGSIEENGVGKFEDISRQALSELKKMGVTHVWYTGVFEHASMTNYSSYGIEADNPRVVKGRAGSPYAIKDYYDINPDLATNVEQRMQEFEELIARTHEMDLKVIMDFVPNHVARSYHSNKKPEGIKNLGEQDDTSVFFSPNNNFYYIPGEKFVPPTDYEPLGANLPLTQRK